MAPSSNRAASIIGSITAFISSNLGDMTGTALRPQSLRSPSRQILNRRPELCLLRRRTAAPAPRRGLLAVKERALMAGGWYKIESQPGLGTTIEFWMPIAR